MTLRFVTMTLMAHLTLTSIVAADESRPQGVAVRQTRSGAMFVDARGMTLYALNARLAGSRSGAPLKYCVGPCTAVWSPLVAPANAKPLGDWNVIDGAQGAQWSYKGNPVFTYIKDDAPGSTAGDGYEDLWKVLAYIPPAPTIVAPASVTVAYVEGHYIMTDREGRALFTTKDKCSAACEQPLLAGMASQPVGDWKVARDGDRPQWTYRGKPVYVTRDERRTHVPDEGVALRP